MQSPIEVSVSIPHLVGLIPKSTTFTFGAIAVGVQISTCKLMSLYQSPPDNWNFVFDLQLSGSITPGIHSLLFGVDTFQLNLKLKVVLNREVRAQIRLQYVDINSPFYTGHDFDGAAYSFSLSELMVPKKIDKKSTKYPPVLTMRAILALLAALTVDQGGVPIASSLASAAKLIADSIASILIVVSPGVTIQQTSSLSAGLSALFSIFSQQSVARWSKIFLALLQNSSSGDLVASVNDGLVDLFVEVEEKLYASYRNLIVKAFVDVPGTVGSWFIPYLKLTRVEKYIAQNGQVAEVRAYFSFELVVNGVRSLVYTLCKDVPTSLTSRLDYVNDILSPPDPGTHFPTRIDYNTSKDVRVPGLEAYSIDRVGYGKENLSYGRIANPLESSANGENQKLLPTGRALSVFVSSSLLSYWSTNFISTGPGFLVTNTLQSKLRELLEVILLKKDIQKLTGWSMPIEFGRFEVMPSVVVTSDDSMALNVNIGHTPAKYNPTAPFDAPYSGLNAWTIVSASIALDKIESNVSKDITASAKLDFLQVHPFELDSDFLSLAAGDVADFIMDIAPVIAFMVYYALRGYLGVAKPYQPTFEEVIGSTKIDFGDVKTVKSIAGAVSDLKLGKEHILLVYGGELTSKAKKLIAAIGKYLKDEKSGKPTTVSSLQDDLAISRSFSIANVPEPFRTIVSTLEMTTTAEGVTLRFSSDPPVMPSKASPSIAQPAIFEISVPLDSPTLSGLAPAKYNPFTEIGNIVEVEVVGSYLKLNFPPIPALLPFFAAMPGLGLFAPGVTIDSVTVGSYAMSLDNFVTTAQALSNPTTQGFVTVSPFEVSSVNTEWGTWWLDLAGIVSSTEGQNRIDKMMSFLAKTPDVSLQGSSNSTQFGQAAVVVKISGTINPTILETLLNIVLQECYDSGILTTPTLQTWDFLKGVVSDFWDFENIDISVPLDSPYLFQAAWISASDMVSYGPDGLPIP